jgi:hypothetical protein
MNWQPTNELRWLEVTKEIEITNPTPDLVSMTVTHQVLQQKWIKPYHPDYCTTIPEPTEWRDVPTEKAE